MGKMLAFRNKKEEKKQKIKLKITEMSNNATTFFFLS